MSIDWITVTAQVFNFLILVWLLKRFLYHPVINAMDRREQRIRAQLTDAESREQAALAAAADYRDKAEALEQQKQQILEQARQEAENARARMLSEAREETARIRANWMRELSEEKAAFLTGLRKQSVEAVTAIARKSLEDLADTTLEARMVQVFADKLASLSAEEKAALITAREPATLSSAWPLDDSHRDFLTRAVQEQLGQETSLTFSTNPELICGIEFLREGHRISWNLSDYMDELGTRIDKAFAPIDPEQQEA